MDNTAQPPLHPLAVVVPVLAAFVVLLDLPPLWWHVRHANVGAGCLILYLVILNFISFVNALIWPRDNFQDWYNGKGFCDVQIRLHLFASFGIGASLICVFKRLADVLDISRTVASIGRDSKRKKLVLDLLLCVGSPSVFILVYYVVQSQRYAIQGISGCVFTWDGTWVGVLLCIMWFPLLQVVAGIYAVVVIFRLVRYSRMFSAMLRNHNSTKSRFYRTFVMSLFLIICLIPVTIYTFTLAFPLLGPYSWDYTHSDWDTIYVYPSFGQVNPDTWTCLVGGVLVFTFFGTGQEALSMYRAWLLKLGAGKMWPSLREEPVRSVTSSSDKWTLLEKKIRKMFGKQGMTDSTGTSRYDSDLIPGSSISLTHVSCTASSVVDPELALPASSQQYPLHVLETSSHSTEPHK